MRQDFICCDPSDDLRLSLKRMTKEKIDGLAEPDTTLKNNVIGVSPSDIPAENGPSMATKCARPRIMDSGCGVDVSGEPGQDTELDLYLPAAPESEAHSEFPVKRTSNGHPIETILVAEDELPVRELVRQALEHLGYMVLEAPNGHEAIRVIEKHTGEIDLLLTDVTMPLMNGQELATRLQTIRPGTKVLYMSGFIDEVLAFHDSAQPEIAFIQKPFSLSELAAKVETALSAG